VNRKGGLISAIAWVLVVLISMGATARYLRNAVNNAFFLRSAGISQNARANLQEYLDRQSENLGNFADQMGQSPSLEESTFQEKAVRLLSDAPVFSAIAFLNDKFRREWVFPFASSRGVQGTELKGPSDALGAAKRALKTGQPAASGLVDLIQGGTGVQLYAPVFQGSLWQGLVEGPIRVGQLAMDLIGPALGRDFHYSIIDERQGREIFTTLSREDRTLSPAYDAFFTLSLADRTWWVLLHPHAPPPTLAIVVGALSAEAILGTLIFILWRRRR
jgi:sensor domain CHASE-containing protein